MSSFLKSMTVPKGALNLCIWLVALSLGFFHLYTSEFGVIPGLKQRVIHITCVMILAFLVLARRSGKSSGRIGNILLALAALACGAYIFIADNDLALRVGTIYTSDLVFGIPFLILIGIATQRFAGWPLVIVALVAASYAFFGHLLPGKLGHRPYGVDDVVYYLSLTTEGIFGTALAVSSTVIAIFVYFGAFLHATGGSDAVNNVAQSTMGHVRGGPAKVAILASALFGSISGSAVANVAATGVVTIPLMKKTGYKPAFAGAVEAVASSGGQIMPPVMGAAAFLMAELLGVSYASIAIAALVPALLYFAAVFIQVDLEAVRLGLKGLPKSELPDRKQSLKEGWTVFTPIIALIVLLMVMGWTPLKAAFWSIALLCAIGLLNRGGKRFSLGLFLTALEKGSHGLISAAMACAISGVVVGVFSLTGLGLKFSGLLISISGGNVHILLVLTMLACIILGMGMATLPCYLVLAVIVAPALIDMGVEPLAAHMFIFYFGIVSGITPPVCVASFTAAGIAESDPMETGFTAVRLGAAALILPFMFVAGPGLLLKGGGLDVVMATVSATCGIVALAIALEGYLREKIDPVSRCLMLVAALTMIKQGVISDLIGFGIFAAVVLVHFKRHPVARAASPDDSKTEAV